MGTPDTASPPARGRRLPRRHALVFLVLALLAGWVAWTAVCAALAQEHLTASRSGLEGVRGDQASDDERLEALEREVSDAAGRAQRAQELLAQPGPALAARVPVLGRAVAAERDVAAAATAVLRAGERLVPLVRQVGLDGGRVDLTGLRALATELEESAAAVEPSVSRLDRAPTGLTPKSVREAVVTARDALSGVPEVLRRSAAGTRAMTGLLGDGAERDLVLVVMNNAELRGAGGYASSFTMLRTRAGNLTVDPFQDGEEVFEEPEQAQPVPAPPQFSSRWGDLLADTTLGKNALVSAHVPSSASVLCEVVRARVGPCDGVVLLDVPALAELLTLTGPVQLPDGSELGGEDLVRELLVDAYAEIGTDDPSGATRREELRRAADEGLRQVLASGLTGVDALRVLADAAAGRHLAVWSADPAEQADLDAAGISGAASSENDDVALVAFNQFGASKLDYYVDRDVEVSARVDREVAVVRATVRLSLDLPEELPEYVVGGSERRLRGLLDVGVGPTAEVVSIQRDGVDVPASVQPEGGAQWVPLQVDLADGRSATWTVVWQVPIQSGRYRLRVLPQPLARDARLDLSVVPADGQRFTGERVTESGPFTRARVVEVRVVEPTWWDRPVQVG